MRSRMRNCGFVALALCAGCIPLSLNPIYDDSVLVYESRLEGQWIQDDSSNRWTFAPGTFGPGEDRTYSVRVEEDGEEVAEYSGHLIQLGKHYFLDLYVVKYPKYEGLEDDLLGMQLVPAHAFFKVEFTDKGTNLFVLDPDWLEQRMDRGRLWAPHIPVEGFDGYPVFTGSTKRMQRFLRKWAGHDEAWGDEMALVLDTGSGE